ncbi:hypothetical protein [Streptomyces sp. YKOK-I1]
MFLVGLVLMGLVLVQGMDVAVGWSAPAPCSRLVVGQAQDAAFQR